MLHPNIVWVRARLRAPSRGPLGRRWRDCGLLRGRSETTGLCVPVGIHKALREAVLHAFDHEAADGAGAREVVENLDVEDHVASPPPPFHQHFAVAQAEGFLEAERAVA